MSCESIAGADLYITNSSDVNIENYYSDSNANVEYGINNKVQISSDTLSIIHLNMTDKKYDASALIATQRTFSVNFSSFSNFSGRNVIEHYTYPNFYYTKCQFLHIYPKSIFIYTLKRVIILDSQFKDCFLVCVKNSIKLGNCILDETNYSNILQENVTESAFHDEFIHTYCNFVRINKVQAFKDIKNTRIISSINYSQISIENCRFDDISNQYSGVVISINDISKIISINESTFRKIKGDQYSLTSSGAIYVSGYDINYKNSKICCLENSGYFGAFLCIFSDENSKAEVKQTTICSENTKLVSIYAQCQLTVNVNYSNSIGKDNVYILSEQDTDIGESLFCNAVLDVHLLNTFIHCDKFLSISNSGFSNFSIINNNNLSVIAGINSETTDLFNCSIDVSDDIIFVSGINIYMRNCFYTKKPNVFYNITYNQSDNQLVDHVVMPYYDYFPSVEKWFAEKKNNLYLLIPIIFVIVVSTLIFVLIAWRKKQRIAQMEMSISLRANLVNDFG
ncbi:hypothetical protein TVAG_469230 [Trichomonas vaginalis G3]|uniref:Uncharacterized protein n=1 Tax=Trichomonas vaginalis (strain ATCC PRA-98 / G3) TaxID=412133 RepID=A2G4X2_TRIV3|nr:hypothetical protein TVAGG3_0433680 [Trichomonas vaginalis G3]EAX87788.1 hypothetical protein TVAG_469230 [Trichomonas vaginalis G3]KAI5536937.1 hypothetical protein TVAGG3_0433680 [Trichomonas vaginalis G3]|eukprot:XP_001300718.1 hypothetical protein [Trichomonas vaginalis G3]